MPAAPIAIPVTRIARHNERIQVAIDHKDGLPVFSSLQVYGLNHHIDDQGAIVHRGENLVPICSVSDPDIRSDVREALMVIYRWADELEAGKDTPEQVDRREREIAEAKRIQREKEAKAKAEAEGKVAP
jgi:hypothetical protein